MKVEEINSKKIDISLLLLRAAGLVLLFTFGLRKLEGSIHYVASGKSWSVMPLVWLVRKVGFPFAQVLTIFAILSESVFALLVAVGVYARICSVLIILSMLGALYTSICISDPVLADGSAIQYCTIFGAIAIMGPGKYSIDGYLKFLALQRKSSKI